MKAPTELQASSSTPQTRPGGALTAAVLALLCLLVLATGGAWYAARVERRSVHAATAPSAQKNQGSALQAAAFGQPDLLPFYGSSELLLDDFHSNGIFAEYPTGFRTFTVANPGNTSLIILQKLAAIGPAVRGRKVAISISPHWIDGRDAVRQDFYAGNFSPLHGYALAFSTELSYELRQAAGRRMLQYPDSLAGEPLLGFALERLTNDRPVDRFLYAATLPLGRLRLAVLRLQDHWETARALLGDGAATEPVRRPGEIDWQSLQAQAERITRERATNNPYGFDDRSWEAMLQRWSQRGRTVEEGRAGDRMNDVAFVRMLHDSVGKQDLDLLLQGLQELGAQPLLLSAPLPGAYLESAGLTARGRAAYYDAVAAIAGRYGVPLVDFRDRDRDRGFVRDLTSHLSPKGWVAYDRALDAFYHDRPLAAAAGR